jgi:hypothetical protein
MTEEISPWEDHLWRMERLRKDAKANRPKALRLADALDQEDCMMSAKDICEAAAELRRLHELNEELLEALLEERRVRLMGQEDDVHWESLRDMRRAAMAATDAAIAKAEGA